MGKIGRIFVFVFFFCMAVIGPQAVFALDPEYDMTQNEQILITAESFAAAENGFLWVRYQAKSDGCLTVQAASPTAFALPAKGSLALYNSAKSAALSDKSISYNTAYKENPFWTEFTFGMKANQIYYIRIKGDNAILLTGIFQEIRDRSGGTKAAARRLKRGQERRGLMAAGTAETDWYKITLGKAQQLKIWCNAKTNGKFRLTLYSGTQQIGSRNLYATENENRMIFYLTKGGKDKGLKAGTYYVKIEKENESSCGSYDIRWK